MGPRVVRWKPGEAKVMVESGLRLIRVYANCRKAVVSSQLSVELKLAGSAADEAGVEGAGQAYVGGALDEGAAVGKDGEGVGGVGEAEE